MLPDVAFISPFTDNTPSFVQLILPLAKNPDPSFFNDQKMCIRDRNTVGVDWIEEWDGTHSQIGENYVITPKLFAGHKTNEGKITGVYLRCV